MVVAFVAVTMACTRQDKSAGAPAESSATASHATTPFVPPTDSGPLDTASVLARIALLEDSLSRSPQGATAPAWLLEAGSLVQRAEGSVQASSPTYHSDTSFVAAHHGWYLYNEVGGDYVYNGYHFTQLLDRFPSDSLAADAAYALTNLNDLGECEGYVPCYLSRRVGPLEAFLRRYPRSSHAPDALRRALKGFADALEPVVTDSTNAADMVDSATVRGMLARYDSTFTELPPALRKTAYEALAPLWDRWGGHARAREMREWLAANRV